MLEKLTKEQEDLIPIVRDDWLKLTLESGKDITRNEVEADIGWVYKKLNLSSPYIFIAESYLAQKLMINVVTGMNIEALKKELKNKNYKPIEKDVSGMKNGALLESCIDQIAEQFYEQLKGGRTKFTKAQMLRIIKSEALKAVPEKMQFVEQFFGLSHDMWLSFYDFFERIGVVKNEDFTRYKNMMRKGIWNIVFYDEACFIAKLPTKVNRDATHRLHSEKEAAIMWRDGVKSYYVRGVHFDKELWTKVVNKELSPKETLQLSNIEQRYIALGIYGADKLLKELDAKKVDSWKEYNLYSFDGTLIPNRKVMCLVYPDPSTLREYASFVPDNIDTCKKAKAWKFQIEVSDLDKLKTET